MSQVCGIDLNLILGAFYGERCQRLLVMNFWNIIFSRDQDWAKLQVDV